MLEGKATATLVKDAYAALDRHHRSLGHKFVWIAIKGGGFLLDCQSCPLVLTEGWAGCSYHTGGTNVKADTSS